MIIPKTIYTIPLVLLVAFVSLFVSYTEATTPQETTVQITIPQRELSNPTTVQETIPTQDQTDEKGSAKININNATLDELQTLPGIGAVKAQAILDYIAANGPIENIDDLCNVKGIAEKSLEKMRPFLTNSTAS